MVDSARVRRTAKLCLECLRGIAYYRAGEKCRDNWIKEDFWIHNNSNSIDMAVIDWCKVFGDRRAEHFWEKSVSDPEDFHPKLLASAGVIETEYNDYIEEMRHYRDKFLTHLDKENRMHIPRLNIALATSVFLYDYWAQGHPDYHNVLPKSGSDFYESRLEYAKIKYAAAT